MTYIAETPEVARPADIWAQEEIREIIAELPDLLRRVRELWEDE